MFEKRGQDDISSLYISMIQSDTDMIPANVVQAMLTMNAKQALNPADINQLYQVWRFSEFIKYNAINMAFSLAKYSYHVNQFLHLQKLAIQNKPYNFLSLVYQRYDERSFAL